MASEAARDTAHCSKRACAKYIDLLCLLCMRMLDGQWGSSRRLSPRARKLLRVTTFRDSGDGATRDGSVQVSFSGHPCRFQSGGEPRWHAP